MATDIGEQENRAREAADQLRANSGAKASDCALTGANRVDSRTDQADGYGVLRIEVLTRSSRAWVKNKDGADTSARASADELTRSLSSAGGAAE